MGSKSQSINQGGLVAIFQGLVNFCWFLFKWGLLAVLIGVVIAVPYLYRHVDEEIRRRVEEKFAEHYDGLRVTVRSAQLVEGEGIEVRDLSILEPGAEGPHAELIHLEELFLACRGDLEEFITGQIEVSRVVLRRPTLRVTLRPDGTWSAAKLLPPPEFTWPPPELTVENGTIEIFDPLKNPAGTLLLRDVNLTLAPAEEARQPGADWHARRLQATLTGDFLRQVQLQGLVDLHRLDWTVEGLIEGLEISPELREALPGALATKLAVLGSLRGQGKLRLRLSYNSSNRSPYRFDLSGQLAQGRLDDPRLPDPLTDMRAAFRLNNDGFAIDELFATSGQSTLWMSCRRGGYQQNSPLQLEAEIRELELDRQLMNILPEALRDQWYKCLPAGRIHADVKLIYDGQTWRPEASVQCLNVAFSYYKFPYRLQQGEGALELKDDKLTLTLTGYSGSQQVRISGEVFHPFSEPTGWLQAEGDNLQLDEKLFSALEAYNQKACAVIRSLDPRGTVNFSLKVWRDQPNQPLHRHLQLGLNRCWMRYEKCPYPFSNIRGAVELVDDRWTFRNLEGTNDTGRITCQGNLVPTPEGNQLVLTFTGTNVPLEEELREALGGSNIQQLWDDLKLQGMVDLPYLEVRYLSGQKKPSVRFRAEPHSESTSIEPVHFPYRLENLRGAIIYNDGRVTLERIKAQHGDTTLSAAGHCDFLPDGSWQLQLETVCVDRLRIDRDLIQALPERLKKTVVELDPKGSINLRGRLEVARGLPSAGGEGAPPGPGRDATVPHRTAGHADDPLTSAWDVELGFHQGSVHPGVPLENLHGSIKLTGECDGAHLGCLAQLALDSISYKDVQFTQVMGPLWIDDDQVLLGAWVDQQRSGRQPRDITAQLFGGTAYGRGWIARKATPRYQLQANLAEADLRLCAQEVMAGRQNLRGRLLAAIDLRGEGRSLNSLGGRGYVRLRDADVYELPLMIALLKILSIREPDRTAFSESDIDFTIQGPHIYCTRMDFKGDAISLEGKGEMDFQTAINLTFRARLGRREFALPVLKELLGGASEQIMLIQVGGTLAEPATTKVPFPGVNQALQQIQDDLQKSTGSEGFLPNARRWMPNLGRALPKYR